MIFCLEQSVICGYAGGWSQRGLESGMPVGTEATATQHHIQPTTSQLTWANRWDHFLARMGYKRSQHRVEAGLYALGNPTPDAPVFVTANYTLSFDALRGALAGLSGYILVLDTNGVNVWCAAGKGTFGTDELVNRIETSGLREVVSHNTVIVPQLGAPGVAAHEVTRRSRFKVAYGPVRAGDLPDYLANGRKATPEMRRVQFTLRDRVALIGVEVTAWAIPTLILAAALLVLNATGVGPIALVALAGITALAAGLIVFPILLPWLPTHNFSTKGFILGGAAALPFAGVAWMSAQGSAWWVRAGLALAYLLTLPPFTAFLALNFTGSTTFTSKSGVKREIYTYFPTMAWSFGIGIVLLAATLLLGG